MASTALTIAQRVPIVEGRLKTLLNNELKAICRANNLGITGTKVVLQNRCITLLRGITDRQDVLAFQELSARVSNHGELPLSWSADMHSSNVRTPTTTYPTYHSAERGLRIAFHKNPFYEKIQTIVRPQDLPAMPQNRHTVKCDVSLNEEQADRIASNPEQYRIMLYCAQADSYNPPLLHIAFPPQIEVKLNDDDVKSNYKGLKGKQGSTKPADLTKLMRSRANYSNKLSICYALTMKKYVFTVMLVRYVNADALVKRIKAGNVFPKQRVLDELRRQNADPDIAATSSKMSLKDPISTLRITTPVRSAHCSHSQCFDASFYMQLQEQAPTWTCPICSKPIAFDSLCIDKYVEEILDSTAKSIEQVTVEPDGEWRVVKEDEDKGLSNYAKGAPRAPYDDDFDDDLVEVDDPDAGIKKELATLPSNAFSTPPLSSRAPSVTNTHQNSNAKRGSAVIDLTLSDDEEPPRPAKRITTASTAPPSGSWLPTPTSMTGRPQSAQPIFLDGNAYPSESYSSAPAFTTASNNASTNSPFGMGASSSAHFDRSADLMPRPGSNASGSNVQWNGLRSPSAPYAPQMSTSHRASISKSPPTWPSNKASPWPRDDTGGGSWQHASMSGSSEPNLTGVRLPSLREQSFDSQSIFDNLQDRSRNTDPSSNSCSADQFGQG